MKRFMVVLFFLGLALMAAPRAQAQFGIATTTVRVVNNTTDGSMVGVEIGNMSSRTLIPYGGNFEVPYYYAGYGVGSAAVFYNITACTEIYTFSIAAASAVPRWATDTSLFGDNALTADYLSKGPAQHNLEMHVSGIIKTLNARDELGRKREKVKPLEAWLKHVKKVGLAQERQSCDPSSEWTGILPGTLDVTSYYNWRVIVIVITGSHPSYHSAIIRGD